MEEDLKIEQIGQAVYVMGLYIFWMEINIESTPAVIFSFPFSTHSNKFRNHPQIHKNLEVA
jgi:hypothetical protein